MRLVDQCEAEGGMTRDEKILLLIAGLALFVVAVIEVTR